MCRFLFLFRCLASILRTCEDPKKLAIAAFDVGQYIDHHPIGKKNIDKLETKHDIMKLISHEDSDVRYNALNSVQKYMSNLWVSI